MHYRLYKSGITCKIVTVASESSGVLNLSLLRSWM